ncbi:hypothetical protein [Bradyrhizobium sp. AS23.2]|uniref:hypothetical protein n=1 Tax=Bradyrhizobium sp. AS23.2 TaxID=1680155 RepID=UPI00093DB7C7|nr:hypothetical protein [Bradyrhizobium sp. AS23.2]OKO70035.1 hypothetical protein AC630_35650 [Bradyrhizobium sp. AS23.2]
MIETIPTPTGPISEAFNAMLASLLRYMADKKNADIDIEAIRRFLAIHDASEPPHILATWDLNTAQPGTCSARTSAILRASLLMVAAMVRGGIDTPGYKAALEQLSEAVSAVLDAMQPPPKPSRSARRR